MTGIAIYPIQANGNSYNEASFDGLAYAANLPNAINDVLASILQVFCSTSASSVTLASSGTISMTIGTGLGYVAGMNISISALAGPPDTDWMAGVVTSYNKATGNLQFTAKFKSGSGTFSSWYVVPAGVNPVLNDATYGIVNAILGTDQGGLGSPLSIASTNDYYNEASPGKWLGLGYLPTSMVEVFEEFNKGNTVSAPLYFPVNTTGLPWASQGLVGFSVIVDNKAITVNSPSTVAGYSSLVGILSLGNNGGWLKIGKGAIVNEWNLVLSGTNDGFVMSFGISACGSVTPTSKIFGNGGIGFTINAQGYFVCVGGSGGTIQTVVTNIYNDKTTFRCRIEIDHTGQNVDYYIRDVLVASIALNTDALNVLCMPCFEARNDSNINTVINAPSINCFYFSKHVMR